MDLSNVGTRLRWRCSRMIVIDILLRIDGFSSVAIGPCGYVEQ